MAKLQQFLDLLDRPDVREVVLQSNSPAAVRTDDGLRAVSRQILTADAVHALVRGTSLERMLQSGDEPHQLGSFELEGRVFAARIAAFGDRLQIRIARSAARRRTGPDSATGAPSSSAHRLAPPPTRRDGQASQLAARLVLREHLPSLRAPASEASAPPAAVAPADADQASQPRDDERPPTAEPAALPPLVPDLEAGPAPPRPRAGAMGGRGGSAPGLGHAATVPALPAVRAPAPPAGGGPARPPATQPEPPPPVAAPCRPPSPRDAPTAPAIPAASRAPAARRRSVPGLAPTSAAPPVTEGQSSAAPAAGPAVTPAADALPTDADDLRSMLADPDLPRVLSVPPEALTRAGEVESAPATPPERQDSDLPRVLGGPPSPVGRPSGEFRLPEWITPRRTRTAETKLELPGGPAGVPEPVAPVAESASLAPEASPGPAEAHLVSLIQQARTEAATDLLLTSGRPPAVRRRGAIDSAGAALSHEIVQAFANTLLSTADLATLASAGHVGTTVELSKAGRLRVHVSRQRAGLRCALRLVATEPATPDALGLPPELARVLEERQGLVVVASPSAQGKSTTLAALVHAVNLAQSVHVTTVETRLEIVHARHSALVSQREVGTHTATAEAALRAALREDPDLIVVDELGDPAAIEVALTAAQTGHLVLAAVNAPSGQRAIERLIERFPRHHHAHVRAQLAGALKLVTAQRLLPDATSAGLVPAVEIVAGGIPLWALIRDDKLFQLPALIRRGKKFGMVGLAEAIETLVRAGRVERSAAGGVTAGEARPPSAVVPAAPVVARPSLRALLEGRRG